MSTKRLFIALTLDHEDELKAARDRLKSLTLGGTFTSDENLHITLAFLGETDETLIPVLSQTINDLRLTEPLSLHFTRYGSFGKELWFLDPGPVPRLASLSSYLKRAVARLGAPVDHKPFRAHLTLARRAPLKDGATLPHVDLACQGTGVTLFWSHREDGRLIYTPLASKAESKVQGN